MQATQQDEGQDRQQHAQPQHQQRLPQKRRTGLFGQLHTSVQTDRQQQDDRQRLVERRRQLQLALHQARKQAEHEEQHYWVDTHLQSPQLG